MKVKSFCRFSFIAAALIFTKASNAQRSGLTDQQVIHRFMPNVPSWVVKGNPLTVTFGYFDAGVEYRTQLSSWLLYTHGFLRGSNSGAFTIFNDKLYVETQNYARFEFGRRWYWQNPSIWNADRETYVGVTMNTGFTNYKFSEEFYYNDLDEVVLIAPLQDASRIDLILAVERGKTRNWIGPTADFYGEMAWKFGYNFGNRKPVLLYVIRLNYKVN